MFLHLVQRDSGHAVSVFQPVTEDATGSLDLYSHVMPGMQADAAEQVDAAIRTAISARDEDKS